MAMQPLHEKITAVFRERIASGEWGEGTIIPPEVELAKEFGVSRPTIRHALEPLVAEGVLDRRRKRGTMVCRAKLGQVVGIDPLWLDATAPLTDHSVRTQVFWVRRATADGVVARRLGIEAGADVVRVTRKRLVDGVPDALADTYVPGSMAQAFLEADLTNVSLGDVLAAAGRPAVRTRQLLEVISARAQAVFQLEVEEGSPVLWLHALAYDADGLPLAYTVATYRSDMNSLVFDAHA